MSSTPTSLAALARLTPSETTLSASTSRPESVSSRIAIFGWSSSIWRISWRFFSPPEKPSLTLRSAKAGSILRLPMADLTSLTHVRSLGASPSIAVLAVRRKLLTVTPGTSTGYCIARKRPARARCVDGHGEHVLAVERHGATGDGVLRVAGDAVGEGRLAGAVGAHDRVRLAGPHGEVDPAQDLLGAVLGLDRDRESLDLERVLGAHRVSSPCWRAGCRAGWGSAGWGRRSRSSRARPRWPR